MYWKETICIKKQVFKFLNTIFYLNTAKSQAIWVPNLRLFDTECSIQGTYLIGDTQR